MMRWRTILILVITIFVFWFLKYFLVLPATNAETVGIILTASSVLFGLLAGFFISELWTRYTEIREFQGQRTSEGLNMIQYASFFFGNKSFEKDFKLRVEKSAIADEVINWNEGYLEIPYYRNIELSFRKINVKNNGKDWTYYDNMMDSYNNYVNTTVKMDTLYRERLFSSEWVMLIGLSVMVVFSVLVLDASNVFYEIVVILFPAIVALALTTIYDLDKLWWGREMITLEPNERILDALGVRRFYLKRNKSFISKRIRNYRTEADLKGDLKQLYLDIVNARKK